MIWIREFNLFTNINIKFDFIKTNYIYIYLIDNIMSDDDLFTSIKKQS